MASSRLDQTDYEIALDRVTVRRTWRMAFMLPLIPVGIMIIGWVIASVKPEPQDATVSIIATLVATLLIIAGLGGTVSVPWFRPRAFTCTAEGVRLDGVLLPASEVGQITSETITRRGKGRVSYGICITITTTGGARSRMELLEYEHPSHPDVDAIVRAMERVVGAPYRQPGQ